MTTYSFSQLEKLWEQAGGSPALASYAAATAIIESGGRTDAYNASGASGLMQLIPSNQHLIPGGNVFNGLDNMIGAVRLSGNTLSGLISNWTDWETTPSGAKYTEAGVLALAKSLGGSGSTPASTPTAQQYVGGGAPVGVAASGQGSTNVSTPNNTPAPPSPSSPGGIIGFAEQLPLIGGLFAAIEPLLHAVATVIDYSFTMFEPGQGQRSLFAVAALILLFLAYKILGGSGVVPHGPKVAMA